MEWTANVIVPAITLIVYICIIGFILFVVIRFFSRLWKQKLKFSLRYELLRTSPDPLIVEECLEAIEKKWDVIKFKMHLLKRDYSKSDIYEILYIFEKTKREMGIKENLTERRFKRK